MIFPNHSCCLFEVLFLCLVHVACPAVGGAYTPFRRTSSGGQRRSSESRYLIKLFAEAEVGENDVAVGVQEDVLQL